MKNNLEKKFFKPKLTKISMKMLQIGSVRTLWNSKKLRIHLIPLVRNFAQIFCFHTLNLLSELALNSTEVFEMYIEKRSFTDSALFYVYGMLNSASLE
jgi:hypothetical protein